MARYLGFRHRCKQTKDEEARPTTVAIREENNPVVTYDLETETAELDFLMHCFPIQWRKVDDKEEIQYFDEESKQGVRVRHCRLRKVKEGEDIIPLHPSHVLRIPIAGKKVIMIVTQVPVAYDGLKSGDVAGMILGGSGCVYACALSRRSEEVSARVFWTRPFTLKEKRGKEAKDDDHLLLARLVEQEQQLFYEVRRRDRDMIRTAEAFKLRMSAMKSRIACGQRLDQRMRDRIFLNEEGRYPEGIIEDMAAAELANEEIYKDELAQERKYDKELGEAMRAMGLWEAIFDGIEGVGPRLAAGLITPIGDIRRFWVEPERMESLYQQSRELEERGHFQEDRKLAGVSDDLDRCHALEAVARWQQANGKDENAVCLHQASQCHKERGRLLSKGAAKLKKYCGVHVNTHDKYGKPLPRYRQFPRRREGEAAEGSPTARLSMYLIGEQFNRRPNSYWGKKLLECKQRFQQKHPEVVLEDVEVVEKGKKKIVQKKRFYPGHILNMALWRTRTYFVVNLFKVWTRIEEDLERQHRAEGYGFDMAKA